MDPVELAKAVQQLNIIAGQVEGQAAGLNPATSTALRANAAAIRSITAKMLPAPPAADAPASPAAPPAALPAKPSPAAK